MQESFSSEARTSRFLKSLGFPEVRVHQALGHFDFAQPSRRILVIGPMGSGKTEYSARIWRDSEIALNKSSRVAELTSTGTVDRRRVFIIRSLLDKQRFADYPEDALAYRGGYVRCGAEIAAINDSFALETLLTEHPDYGTWIIDEASFYDERIAYVVQQASQRKGQVFVFPTLILNFRREIFNPTARLLLETATDVFPLTAYCEHKDCIKDSFYTYRYYQIDGEECPALFFDPLIVIGGDKEKDDPLQPNYCTRCDEHHFLPGKEYTYFILKPLGEMASRGEADPLRRELAAIKDDIGNSRLAAHLQEKFHNHELGQIYHNALKVPLIAEKALIYLYAEQNLLAEEQLIRFIEELKLDRKYMGKTLKDNRRGVNLEQQVLWEMFP